MLFFIPSAFSDTGDLNHLIEQKKTRFDLVQKYLSNERSFNRGLTKLLLFLGGEGESRVLSKNFPEFNVMLFGLKKIKLVHDDYLQKAEAARENMRNSADLLGDLKALEDLLVSKNFWDGFYLYGSLYEAFQKHLNKVKKNKDVAGVLGKYVQKNPGESVEELLKTPLDWSEYHIRFLEDLLKEVPSQGHQERPIRSVLKKALEGISKGRGKEEIPVPREILRQPIQFF